MLLLMLMSRPSSQAHKLLMLELMLMLASLVRTGLKCYVRNFNEKRPNLPKNRPNVFRPKFIVAKLLVRKFS